MSDFNSALSIDNTSIYKNSPFTKEIENEQFNNFELSENSEDKRKENSFTKDLESLKNMKLVEENKQKMDLMKSLVSKKKIKKKSKKNLISKNERIKFLNQCIFSLNRKIDCYQNKIKKLEEDNIRYKIKENSVNDHGGILNLLKNNEIYLKNNVFKEITILNKKIDFLVNNNKRKKSILKIIPTFSYCFLKRIDNNFENLENSNNFETKNSENISNFGNFSNNIDNFGIENKKNIFRLQDLKIKSLK